LTDDLPACSGAINAGMVTEGMGITAPRNPESHQKPQNGPCGPDGGQPYPEPSEVAPSLSAGLSCGFGEVLGGKDACSMALPAELDHAQRVELVRDFCQRQFVDRGMVADIALHAPGREGDDRNHHAHILLTTREVTAEGFTTKNRDWNAVEVLEGWREAWGQDANLALELAGHGERIDHRTLEAQRIEALELARVAQEQGHEAEALEHTIRAVALDRPPLPQLSAGAWQLKERGQEVAAVRVWHEVKAHAAEVARVAQELAGHVRTWLERAADHVLDMMQPPEAGLVYEGSGHDRARPQDLAARMREAWALRDEPSEIGETRSAVSEERSEKPDAPQSLADRLRVASKGLDHEEIAARLVAIRQGWELEERDKARELERQHAEELEQEHEVELQRGRTPGHEL